MFLLLNSFDRSGSTLISHLLSKHPNIETLFNPFNSTIFRNKFMEYWGPKQNNINTKEGLKIINYVINDNMTYDKIPSIIFHNNSSTKKLKPDSLHIIKTTNFHLKQGWFQTNYPNIPIYILIRNPLEILTSLVRNNFHLSWYGNWAFKDLCNELKQNEYLSENIHLKNYINFTDPVKQMAFIIGVLNHFTLININTKNIICYEELIINPNKALNGILEDYKLSSFDFTPFINESINSSGKPFENTNHYNSIFTKNEIIEIIDIFKNCGYQGYDLTKII